jgi:hypothetical protein
MSKFSENASDGSYQSGFIEGLSNAFPKKKKKKQQHNLSIINMKKGALATQHSGGNFADLKIDSNRHQTFNSDLEDSVGHNSSVI